MLVLFEDISCPKAIKSQLCNPTISGLDFKIANADFFLFQLTVIKLFLEQAPVVSFNSPSFCYVKDMD
jgi:hypothetical protein